MKDGTLEKKIEQLRAGDARAFDYIYEKTNRSVYFALLYILRDRMAAEDVLQETYVRAIRAIDSYTAGTNFPAWLTRIGKNLAEIPYIFDVATGILAEDEYEIVMLCHVSGYKRREVAAMLDMPVGTETWKNNEALKKLRRHLQKEGDA